MLTFVVFVAILIAALVIMAAFNPNTFSLVRSAQVRAPADRVFAQLNDFKNWGNWSPWDKMDPNLKRTYSGAASGKGSKYSWIGNKKVGEGAMEITRSTPYSSVQLDLNFLKPFKASNVTEFTLTPSAGGTLVKWEMRGPLNLMMKLMHMFMDMDGMVGKDFEKGLASLKTTVEK